MSPTREGFRRGSCACCGLFSWTLWSQREGRFLPEAHHDSLQVGYHKAPCSVFNIPVIYASPLSSLALLLFCLGYHILQCLSFLQFRDGRAGTERLETMWSKALNPQALSPGDFGALSLLHVAPTQWGVEAR